MAILNITVHKTVEDEYYFRLRNIAGKLLLTSRNYFDLRKCLCDIYDLQVYRNFMLNNQVDPESKMHRFFMETCFGIVIAQSSVYESMIDMREDMQFIVDNIRTADVEDRSTKVKFFRMTH